MKVSKMVEDSVKNIVNSLYGKVLVKIYFHFIWKRQLETNISADLLPK